MIGVIVDQAQTDVVREFFELFKTPWQFYREGREYDVVLSTETFLVETTAPLVICYASKKTDYDEGGNPRVESPRGQSCFLSYRGHRTPIYGATVTFLENETVLLKDVESQECLAYLRQLNKQAVVRVGYDLFGEIRALLTSGQPAVNANSPTLDLHIAFLRDLITRSGLPLVEVPPLPAKYQFVACLTHDVDHPSLQLHKWDHTAFGFLYRAIFGSLRSVIRGRMPFRDLLKNWVAAAKLPLIHLGLAKDFWSEFADRYLQLEKGVRSTFFVIPRKNHPGQNSPEPAPAFRAARYELQDVAGAIQKLKSAGHEIGLHGIDAWRDSSSGRDELEEIRRVTGDSQIGVRMHWLYYDQQSPVALEKAGAVYDSTVGYNQTTGYRAGTTQVYKPLGASNLLELPLHAMDTALFCPDYLDLSPKEAAYRLARLIENAAHFGGCLTINWHDRSTFPERLWGACYQDLLENLKTRGAWFATAREAASWFRKRRTVQFEVDPNDTAGVRTTLAVAPDNTVPGLRLRIYGTRNVSGPGADNSQDYVDVSIDEDSRMPLTRTSNSLEQEEQSCPPCTRAVV
jgi:peptidoglycan/xylan/chitin deacetylase (PgdA/CDA1 family)